MSINKIAIVTGANKGLGFSIVKHLCEKYDGKVYLTSRDEKRGKSAIGELNKIGLSPVFHQLDVTNDESIKKFVSHIRAKNEEVEILINNAGIFFLKDAPEPIIFQVEQTMSINFTALVNLTEAILPFMKTGGKILNISSSSGHLCRIPSEKLRKKFQSEALNLDELKSLVKNYVEDVKQNKEISNGWGDSPYVVSKVAVNAYTFMLHRKLSSKGIIVNCMHPGYVMTDMTLGNGSVSPAEAALLPVQLALTPEYSGRYVWNNGQDIPWDGPDPRAYIDGKQV